MKDECHVCNKPFIPAEDCLNYVTGKWDGKSMKADCEHLPSNLRISHLSEK